MSGSSTKKSDTRTKALFYELIQVCLSHREYLSRNPTHKEWYELYEMSKQQAILGVVFPSLDKLALCGQKPPLDILYKWIAFVEHIKRRNSLLNERCGELLNLSKNPGLNRAS